MCKGGPGSELHKRGMARTCLGAGQQETDRGADPLTMRGRPARGPLPQVGKGVPPALVMVG